MQRVRQPINRRQFSAAVSCGATLALTSGVTAERPPANFRLRYIVGSPMYGTAPLEEVVREVRKTGATAVDIWPRPHANHREQMEQLGFDRVHALLDRFDVQLAAITRYDLGPYRITDELPALTEFGGKLLVCGAKDAGGDTLKQRVRRFVDSLLPHAEKAAEAGVRLGIENHSGTLLNSPDSIRYFAEFAKPYHLGLAMAPYHLPQDPHLIASLIRDLDDNLVFFQAWQHGNGCMKKLPKEEEMLQMPGRGPLDFRPILRALQEIDYQGWTEIFMHPVPRGIPVRETTKQVTREINSARAYLTSCLPVPSSTSRSDEAGR